MRGWSNLSPNLSLNLPLLEISAFVIFDIKVRGIVRGTVRGLLNLSSSSIPSIYASFRRFE
jgi:hypothetical protein